MANLANVGGHSEQNLQAEKAVNAANGVEEAWRLEFGKSLVVSLPLCSKCGIFTYIWLKFMVNVGKYLHGVSRLYP